MQTRKLVAMTQWDGKWWRKWLSGGSCGITLVFLGWTIFYHNTNFQKIKLKFWINFSKIAKFQMWEKLSISLKQRVVSTIPPRCKRIHCESRQEIAFEICQALKEMLTDDVRRMTDDRNQPHLLDKLCWLRHSRAYKLTSKQSRSFIWEERAFTVYILTK